MGLFSKLKGEGDLVLILDIRSSSVGGALVRVPEGKGIRSPRIFSSERSPIKIEKNPSIKSLLDSTANALEEVSKAIEKVALGAPKSIFCVLSSPWYISQVRSIAMEKNTQFVFTTKLAEGLIEKERKLFEEQNLKNYFEQSDKPRLIELKNMKVSLNGYHVSDPIGKKARELEMNIFVSMSPESVLTRFEQVISRHFHFDKINFSSLPFSSFVVSRDLFIADRDFLLMDVGGEVTDIALIKDNLISEIASFPIGKNSVIRSIAKSFGSGLEEAKSIFSMYQDDHIEKVTKEKAEMALGTVRKDWTRKFEESLQSISDEISIPYTIFLTADSDAPRWFIDSIKKEQFHQYTFTESKFNVIMLDARFLHGIATYEKDVARDPFLIIDSIYITRFI